MAEGAIVSHRPVPMCPKLVQSFRGKSRGGSGISTTIVVDSRKLVNIFEVWKLLAFRVWHLVRVQRVGECTYEQG
jgi:hypothetical protein